MKSMPIDRDFPRKLRVMGIHRHADGKQHHLVWGPGKNDGKSSTDSLVQQSYKKRGEPYLPLGVHGTIVAVDWDSCIACGACIEECRLDVFQWYRTEQDIPAVEMSNITSAGIGESSDKNGRNDYTDKPDPIRENDCNCCKACVAACPTQAIEVYQDNIEYHNKASDTFLNADYS
jgi:NAD-dependent dihydropyrimidine dehydrogenase PreA subunit